MLKYLLTLAIATVAFGAYECNNVQPPSGSNYPCGDYGTATQAPALTFRASLDDCKFLGDRNQSYRRTFSFQFNTPSTHVCNIYTSHDLNVIGYQPNASSALSFFDYRCFSCRSVCPDSNLQGVPNQVFNPEFEYSDTSLIGWSIADNNWTISHPGANSASLNAAACVATGKKPFCNLQQILPTCPLTTYLLSFAYRVTSADSISGAQILQIEAGDSNSLISTRLPNARNDTGWHRAYFSFSHSQLLHPNQNYGRIAFSDSVLEGHGPTSTFYQDDVVVRPLRSPIPTGPGAVNLLRNGGFDSSATRVAPWVKYPSAGGSSRMLPFLRQRSSGAPEQEFDLEPRARPPPLAQIISPGHAGSKHAIRLRSNAFVAQNVTTVPGAPYVVSFVWKPFNSSVVDQGRLGPLELSMSSVVYGNTTNWAAFKGRRGNGGWFTFERLWVATASRIQVIVASSTDNVVDNVSVMRSAVHV